MWLRQDHHRGAPFGAAGTVVYGPNLNAAAILLASEGNVPLERTATLMAMLLGVPVSAGFVARALERFAQRLQACGFDEAMKTALRAQDVLCADETVRHETLVRREALGVEGCERPSRWVVAAAWWHRLKSGG